jgi:UDP-N-acetylenolpyruvoylglucosamine reductase
MLTARRNARMNFEPTEEQAAIRELAASFAASEMAPHAAKWDAEHIFPRDVIVRTAELGFGGLYVREDVGGSNLSRLEAAIIFEELAKACPSTSAFISIHNMAAWMIERCGLKGCRDGDAGVSEQHALVLVNLGAATGADLLRLARRVQSEVSDRFGVALEPEPRIVEFAA